MANPFGKFDDRHAHKLEGPLLRFLPEDDQPDEPEAKFESAPAKPRHAPRTLMCAALYEVLCQAFTYVNSPGYRREAGEPNRMRCLRHVILTYPAGMIAAERERFQKQAQGRANFRADIGQGAGY